MAALLVVLAPSPAVAASCSDTWTNAAGGAWETAANWSNGVPTGSDVVCIALANVTVTITGDNESAASLTLGGGSGSDTLQLTQGGLAGGTLTLSANSNVASGGKVTTSGAGGLNMSSGTLTNDGTLTGPSLNLAGDITNESDGTITVTGSASMVYGGSSGGTLTNDGAIDVGASATFDVEGNNDTISNPSGTIGNLGTFELTEGTGESFNEGNGTVTGNAISFNDGNGGSLDITGTGSASFNIVNDFAYTLTGNVAAGQTITLVHPALQNGTLTLTESLTNAGLITTSTGGTLTIPSADTLTNTGTISGTSLTLVGNITNDPSGTITIPASGSWVYSGSGGMFINEGAFNVDASATFNVEGNDDTISNAGGAIANQGTFELTDGTGETFNEGAGTTSGTAIQFSNGNGDALDLTGSGSSSFTFFGNASGNSITGNVASGQTITLAQSALEGGVANATGSFSNSGTIVAQGSANLGLPSSDTLTNNGSIVVPPADTFAISGNLDNASTGTIELEASSTQGSKLNFDGASTTLTNAGTIEFGIGGASTFGTLAISGSGTTIALGGSADPLLEGGFTPTINQEFDVITGPHGGTFTTVENNFSGDYTHSGFVGIVAGPPPTVSTTTTVTSSQNPSTFGGSVTFTATVNPSDGGGTVSFFADGSNTAITGCSSVSLNLVSGNEEATCATTTLAVGNHTISASYSGDTGYSASSGSLNSGQTVNQAGTTTSLASSQTPAPFGMSVTFTATVSPSDGNGTVSFFADGSGSAINGCGSVSLSLVSGTTYQATCSTSALSAGNHTISASYTGDTDYAQSSGSLVGGQTVSQVSTTTTVASSQNPSAFGVSVTFTATVSPSDGSGSVSFIADGSNTAISGCGASSLSLVSGTTYQATCPTSALSVGSHSITATYSGDTDYAGSSGSLSPDQSVGTQGTSTAVASSANPSTFGASITFTATVSPSDGSGSVSFFADGSTTAMSGCGSLALSLVSGSSYKATCATSTLAVGSHTISATYSGDTNFASSSGSLSPEQSVGQVSTATSVATSGSPSIAGSSVTFTASIGPSDGGGTVSFFADGSATAISGCGGLSLTLVSGSTYEATCTTSTLGVGNHTIGATYSGDTDYAGSSGSLSGGQTVNSAGKIATTTTLAFGPLTGSPPRLHIPFVATVKPASGTGFPTGTIAWYNNGAEISLSALNAANKGQDSISISGNLACPCSLTAVYSGDANFSGSTSNQLTPDRTDYPGQATTPPLILLIPSPNPAKAGQPVNLIAVVVGSTPVTPVGGLVTFTTGATTLGTASVTQFTPPPGSAAFSDFSATLTTSFSNAGTYPITATYSGTWELAATSPGSATETVTGKTATSFTASAQPTSTSAGHAVTLSASGLPRRATGTVTFSAGGKTLCVATIGGTSPFPTRTPPPIQCTTSTALAPGSYSVTATYSGDANFLGSTATTSFRIING